MCVCVGVSAQARNATPLIDDWAAQSLNDFCSANKPRCCRDLIGLQLLCV